MQQKSINLIHRKFKFPEIESSNKSNRSRGSPTSSRNNTSQERDISIDGGNSIQVFKIRNVQVSERSLSPKEEKIFNMSKSTQLKSRQEQNEDYTDRNSQELMLPKIYSPILTPNKNIVVTKMKDSIFKPLLCRQEIIDHQINIKLQNKIHDQLKKGVNIKCLYLSQRTDVQINKIIVLNFDSLVLGKRKSFWEQQNEITMCSQIIGSKCDNSYCACALQKELKSTLSILSKQFYIVLLFECTIRGQVWQQFLIESRFSIDAIYCIQQIRLNGGGIKMKQIISNFGNSDIKQLLYFGTIDCESQYIMIPKEQFYYQIPIIQAKTNVLIYLFQLQKSKFLDSKLLFEICMLNCNKSESFNYKRPITIINYDLELIIKQMIYNEEEDIIQNYIYKNLKQEDDSVYEIKEDQEEGNDQKNLLLIWLYQAKKLLLDYFKSINNEDQIQNPISMLGDVLRRNTSIQLNFISENYEKQTKRYKLYNELKSLAIKQPSFRKQIQIDCLIIYD